MHRKEEEDDITRRSDPADVEPFSVELKNSGAEPREAEAVESRPPAPSPGGGRSESSASSFSTATVLSLEWYDNEPAELHRGWESHAPPHTCGVHIPDSVAPEKGLDNVEDRGGGGGGGGKGFGADDPGAVNEAEESSDVRRDSMEEEEVFVTVAACEARR